MRRVLNPCSACEGSAVPAPCPSPSLSRAHAEQLPSVVRLLLGKGREARQAVQGHRGGTPARCCGGDAPDPGKTEAGRETSVCPSDGPMDCVVLWCVDLGQGGSRD